MVALADRPFAELLDDVAAERPAPGAGSSTALTAALAAALLEMASAFTLARAEYSAIHDRCQHARERAAALRADVVALADRDLDSYAPVLDALRLPADDPDRAHRLRAALAEAAVVPLAIARSAGEVAELAAELGRDGNRHLLGESITATLLAEAACRAAVALVELDLAAAPADDPGLVEARRLAEVAAGARAQVLA